MIEPFFLIILAGFVGGTVRGVVGVIKYQFRFKNVEFKPLYFLGMVVLSGIVGLLTAITVRESGIPVFGGVVTPAIAFIIGYAGGDFIENIYKIVVGKS